MTSPAASALSNVMFTAGSTQSLQRLCAYRHIRNVHIRKIILLFLNLEVYYDSLCNIEKTFDSYQQLSVSCCSWNNLGVAQCRRFTISACKSSAAVQDQLNREEETTPRKGKTERLRERRKWLPLMTTLVHYHFRPAGFVREVFLCNEPIVVAKSYIENDWFFFQHPGIGYGWIIPRQEAKQMKNIAKCKLQVVVQVQNHVKCISCLKFLCMHIMYLII